MQIVRETEWVYFTFEEFLLMIVVTVGVVVAKEALK